MTVASTITQNWARLQADGDSRISNEAIACLSRILELYEKDIRAIHGDKERAQHCLLSAVRSLNALGGLEGQYGNIIETDDRELLVPWMIALAKEGGLEVREGEDPTFDERTW